MRWFEFIESQRPLFQQDIIVNEVVSYEDDTFEINLPIEHTFEPQHLHVTTQTAPRMQRMSVS
jgi:hypothetical protein